MFVDHLSNAALHTVHSQISTAGRYTYTYTSNTPNNRTSWIMDNHGTYSICIDHHKFGLNIYMFLGRIRVRNQVRNPSILVLLHFNVFNSLEVANKVTCFYWQYVIWWVGHHSPIFSLICFSCLLIVVYHSNDYGLWLIDWHTIPIVYRPTLHHWGTPLSGGNYLWLLPLAPPPSHKFFDNPLNWINCN